MHFWCTQLSLDMPMHIEITPRCTQSLCISSWTRHYTKQCLHVCQTGMTKAPGFHTSSTPTRSTILTSTWHDISRALYTEMHTISSISALFIYTPYFFLSVHMHVLDRHWLSSVSSFVLTVPSSSQAKPHRGSVLQSALHPSIDVCCSIPMEQVPSFQDCKVIFVSSVLPTLHSALSFSLGTCLCCT